MTIPETPAINCPMNTLIITGLRPYRSERGPAKTDTTILGRRYIITVIIPKSFTIL